MTLNPQILRSSFDLVLEAAPDLTHRFYENLFAMYPQLAPMFSPTRRRSQEKMLADALTAVLDHLEDAPWLTSTLKGLGAKHVGYGVTDEMYGFVGAALLKTLADIAGAAFTDEVRAQWSEAFGVIAGLMQAGAREAPAHTGTHPHTGTHSSVRGSPSAARLPSDV
jgi:hemoglobin-like flavoprotein